MLHQHLEKLTHFTGVVKAGSIRGYANRYRLSQPAISKCIQNLETVLEASLMLRTKDGIELTQAGRDLYHYSESILAQAAQIHAKIRARGRIKISGELTLGTYQSIAVYFLPRFFRFIQREQGDLRLNFFCAPSAELVKALRSGRIDMMISIDPPSAAEFKHTQIFEDTFSIYRRIGLTTSVSTAPIFTLPTARDCRGRTTLAYLKDANLSDHVTACGDFESVKAMVEEGVGFGLMPDRVAASLVALEKIEKVPSLRRLHHVGKHNVVFSCRKHREGDSAILWLKEQLLLMLSSNK